jgi:hypothetical protein
MPPKPRRLAETQAANNANRLVKNNSLGRSRTVVFSWIGLVELERSPTGTGHQQQTQHGQEKTYSPDGKNQLVHRIEQIRCIAYQAGDIICYALLRQASGLYGKGSYLTAGGA